jgi:hypothetical protein
MSAAEIHLELRLAVYSQNVMFKDWLTNVHDEERIGRLSICSE